MPPMVAREEVETSTGNHSPVWRSCRFSSSSTMPGSTTQVRASGSTEISRFRCLEKSMTSARPTVWPDWEVAPPRGSSGTPSSRAIAIAVRTSSMRLGHHHADAARSGSARHPSNSARARSGRTAPPPPAPRAGGRRGDGKQELAWSFSPLWSIANPIWRVVEPVEPLFLHEAGRTRQRRLLSLSRALGQDRGWPIEAISWKGKT